MENELTGDWDKLMKLLKNLPKKMPEVIEDQLKKDGQLILDTLQSKKDYIENSDSGLTSENFVITYSKDTQGNYSMNVGVKEGEVEHNSGKLYSDILEEVEMGTPEIPPRPILRSTLEQVKMSIINKWDKRIKDISEGND